MAVDAAGNLFISDTGRNRILTLDAAGNLLRAVGQAGSGAGEFKQPRGLAIDKQGHVHVADP